MVYMCIVGIEQDYEQSDQDIYSTHDVDYVNEASGTGAI